jgi:hypothetical protein
MRSHPRGPSWREPSVSKMAAHLGPQTRAAWIALATAVREGKLELPRPLGRRILELVALRTISVLRVVLCPRMSSCREQAVSKNGTEAISGVSRRPDTGANGQVNRPGSLRGSN